MIFSVFFLLLTASHSFADACQPSDYRSLLKCMEEQSLETKIAEQELKAGGNLPAIARQWPNPELEIESVRHNAAKGETTASLLFSLPISGKRGAGIAGAEASKMKSEAESTLQIWNHRLESMLQLYRLSHLKSELSIARESIETYRKILEQFQKKPALSPEQQVSLSVFRMAVSDTELRLVKLQSEEELHYRSIEASTGLPRAMVEKNLPSRKTEWPPVSEGEIPEQSPVLRLALSEKQQAQSQLEGEKSAAWPELKIGPSLKAEKDGATSEKYYGVALSLPLPLLSWNGAGQNLAQDKLAAAEISLELARRKNRENQTRLIKKYRGLTSALRKSLGPITLQKNHEEIERHFFRGLVSSSLVIEAHRQLFDLEKSRNESELEGLEALGQIQIIHNQFPEIL